MVNYNFYGSIYFFYKILAYNSGLKHKYKAVPNPQFPSD